MLQSSIPVKFPVPFASSAGSPYKRQVPTASQIGIQPGAASLTDGFPPVTFLPTAGGGTPPWGADFNGLLYQITAWNQWQQAGGPITYDSAFATSIGGYPRGAVVMSNVLLGAYYLNTTDGNAGDPDAGAANWVQHPGMAQTGNVMFSPAAITPPGWIISVASFTIGNAASGASYAAADSVFLFKYLWTNFSNTQCPVSGGRGANAAADFAANKRIGAFDYAGSGIVNIDNATNRLSGVPVVSGGINTAGSIIGENVHTLTLAEIPAHNHNFAGNTQTENVTHTHSATGTTGSENLPHVHTSNGTLTTQGMNRNDPHTHSYNNTQPGSGTFGVQNFSGNYINFLFPQTTGSQTVAHEHNYSFTTGGETTTHTHDITISATSIQSAFHYHAYSGTTDGGNNLAGAAHNNTGRSVVSYPLMKL